MMAPPAKRILIVEDNKIHLRLLRDILVAHGYETLQTNDGLDAINVAWANRPDLILMDIRLPHLSGLAVTRLGAQPSLGTREEVAAFIARFGMPAVATMPA